MTTSDALSKWKDRYASEITVRAPDVAAAGQRVGLARTHLARARQQLDAGEHDLALNLAENALVVACDAVLFFIKSAQHGTQRSTKRQALSQHRSRKPRSRSQSVHLTR
jgi:hypothetical protein